VIDAAELEAAALDASDAGQAGRLRAEAQACRSIETADDVLEAFLVLEQALPQISPRALGAFVDRAARLYGHGLHRLKGSEQEAMRRTLGEARREG